MSIINAIWKLKKVVTITPNNYNELKKVTDLVDGFIKNKQAVLSKKQNKIFNQQKNEIKRFEDSQEANRDDIIGGLNRLREYLGGTPPKKSAEVLPFRYKKSFKQEIDEMSKPAPTVGGKTIEEALGGISWADKKKKAKRIKQGLSTKIKLNTLGENKQLTKELVSGKNSEFNTLDKAAKREVLDRLEINIKNAKADFATPVKPEDLASGGRIGFGGGLLAKGWKLGTEALRKKKLIEFRKKYRPGFGKSWDGASIEEMDKILNDIKGLGSLDDFVAEFYKQTGKKIKPKDLKKAYEDKLAYPHATPIIDDTGRVTGGSTQQKLPVDPQKFEIRKSDWSIDDPVDLPTDVVKKTEPQIGKFTKAEVLIQRLKNTLKKSNDPYVKKNFPNWIKEIEANPKLADNENVWRELGGDLPADQRLIVHSDDSVDFFTQSKFGPHNIEKTLEFQKKHNLSRDQANKILRMEPEDRVLEMTRLEKLSRGKPHASGGLAYMLGEPTYSDGGRIGFKGGTKFDPTKRKFLKGAGAGLAALSALPFVGKFFKWAKPAAKVLTKVPIEQTGGMPVWFPKLVNKVIKQGDDVTKQYATVEREIVHQVSLEGKLGKDALGLEDVRVTQNLDEGTIRVEYDTPNSMGEGGVQLEYKASEIVEDASRKAGKEIKTKPEFTAVESEPRVVNYDGDMEWDGENIVNAVDDLLTDTTKLETYATGKKPTIKKLLEGEKKQKYVNKLNDDVMEQAEYVENKYGPGPEPSDDLIKGIDYASGGRVPFFLGGRYKEGAALLREMVEYFAKGSKHGKKPSEYLKISNPKQFQKMLNDLSIYKKYHKGEGIMAPDMIKEMIKKTEGDRADIIEHIISSARNIKKSDDSIAVYKKKMVDEMVKKGADKKTAEMLADGMTKVATKNTPKITEEGLLELETIYKNMLMKGRKPNASGGLAYMLGEPTYAEGGRIPYQTGGTKTTEIRRADWTPTVMPPLQQVRQSPVETTQDVVVDTAAGPFAGAKTAAITEAQGRKMPFENYYVGANPTAEQAAFMQEKGAVPFRMRGISALPPEQQNKGIMQTLGDVSGYTQHNINNQLIKNALAEGRINENQYKRMGGYDVAQQLPGGVLDVPLTAAATLGYQGIKKLAGGEYDQYGPWESADLNIAGAQGLNPADLQTYESIIGEYKPVGGMYPGGEKELTPQVSEDPLLTKYATKAGEGIYNLLNPEAAAATPTPDVTKPIMADVAGPKEGYVTLKEYEDDLRQKMYDPVRSPGNVGRSKEEIEANIASHMSAASKDPDDYLKNIHGQFDDVITNRLAKGGLAHMLGE